MSIHKRVLLPQRVRELPPEGFSWVDRRFFRDGYAPLLPAPAILLYLFLCAVADRQGLSFYGDQRICRTLGLDPLALDPARRGLIHADLLGYHAPLYQVLSLPPVPREVDLSLPPRSAPWGVAPPRKGALHCAKEIFGGLDLR